MISIIVPAYNAAPYLDACLASLKAQTTKEPLQIIVIDDGSEDETQVDLLLDRYAAGPASPDRSLTLLEQPHAGQSAARNLGLKHAKGEYIAFVDADDTIAPDWCERHMAAIEGADYVQSGYKRVSGLGVSGLVVSGSIPKHRYQFTSPCMRLYRHEAIKGMRFEEGMIYEDVVWSVDLWQRRLRCRMLAYDGYRYTLNPESTTSQHRPDAQRKVFAVLHQRARKASLWGKILIAYTILRLKVHFIRS